MTAIERVMTRTLTFLALTLTLVACGSDGPVVGEKVSAFTAGMKSEDGFVSFFIDEQKGKVYLLLPNEPQELLYQESLPRGVGSNDIGLDRGQLGGRTALVRFEPAGNKVLLKKVNLRYRAQSKNEAERQAVEQAFASSVLWGFPIEVREGNQLLVDATDFLLRDTHGIGRRLKGMGEGSYKADKSRSALYPPRSRAFPRNTELEVIITLTGSEPGPELRSVAPDPYSVTVHMHHSFIALPEEGYEPRVFHPSSGFWAMTYADYAAPLGEALEKRFIPRHRMQKKNPEQELSEAVEPLVYYLDPGTPEPVRSALLEGGQWWADAFEAAGFKDAFRVEMLPEYADPMDVRYNLIQWVHRSTRGWSYGSVIDPRTSEIIKGHVTLGSLRVRQDLLLARGMTSPFAEGGDDTVAKDMALARIRQLSAHEIGHTLGLAHNFAASAKDRASVMDYPYPDMMLSEEGAVVLDDAYAVGIGDWDKRAIRYGYGEYGDSESEALKNLIAENEADGFEFISDPDSRAYADFHPRSHLWDNGGNAVDELNKLMALRAAALSRFGPDSIPQGAPLSDLQEALVPVFLFHRYQVEAAGKLVGGVDYQYVLNRGGTEVAAEPVDGGEQRRAIEALLGTLSPDALTLPNTVIDAIPPKAYGYSRNRESAPSRTGAQFDPVTLGEAAAAHTLRVLLHPERLARLELQASLDDSLPSSDELFRQLQKQLLDEELPGLEGAVSRRAAGLLLEHWRKLQSDSAVAPEVRAAAIGALDRSKRSMRANYRSSPAYRAFYRYESWRIEKALEGDAVPVPWDPTAIPPGSPIGSF